ncbi:hypothetical protein QFZ43_001629 [Streptomyces afghaniensis]|nr:hypothetical protein [Streptomyces afghaniensis]
MTCYADRLPQLRIGYANLIPAHTLLTWENRRG